MGKRSLQLREARRIIETANRGGYFDACHNEQSARELALELLNGQYPVKIKARSNMQERALWKAVNFGTSRLFDRSCPPLCFTFKIKLAPKGARQEGKRWLAR